jgi:hypothetical protein
MRNDTQLEHVDPETLSLFAMRALTDEEYARIQGHIDDCMTCRREVQQIQGELGLLAIGGLEIVAPPAGAKARLMAEIKRESRARKSSPGTFWKWAFALSNALALALITVVLHQRGELLALHHGLAGVRASLERERAESEEAREIKDLLQSSNTFRLALASSKSRPEPEAHTIYDPHRGRVFVVANHLEALPPEKTYELWLLPKSGAAPIPAGLFKSDANGSAQMLYAGIPSGQEAKGFAVTVEPRQGSQAPTTTPLLVGLAGS